MHPGSDDEQQRVGSSFDASPSVASTGAVRTFMATYLRGMAMGAADIVPGVSGGTMALILGIYQKLIGSIRAIARPAFLGALTRGDWRRAVDEINGPFLLALAAGIATSVLALSRLLSTLLETRPVFVYAFFFGLILASVVLVARRIERRGPFLTGWLLFGLGAVAAFLLVGLTPAQTPQSVWFLFLSGALAVSALLLPGISGAFVLVLLGKYEFVLHAITRFDIAPLAAVIAGAVAGMLSFAQVLGWLFRKYHDATLALLCGIMLGALRKVWPWQSGQGETTVNLPPPTDWWSTDQGVGWVILLALLGAVLVSLLDRPAAPND